MVGNVISHTQNEKINVFCANSMHFWFIADYIMGTQ
jgi:hypothetical protein